ncbi:MAG: hypothetical protein F4109_05790 [Gammaproteobacteria bacterium]|nr:hypothetical protein [Gammaproteobacteria bacterium]MYD01178.1 hypothetical protein [Gammaproteobacteria bacterium]MYI24926.1 hypothetical protein [Gammaproteobacteria bacterium]
MTTAALFRARTLVLLAGAVLAVCCTSASAAPGRDIVFECPCSAKWVADESGEAGVLTVRAGFRSHRLIRSGKVRLSSRWWDGTHGASVGPLQPGPSVAGEWTVPMNKSDIEDVVQMHLLEESALHSDGASQWYRHETLALWPVPRNAGEEEAGRMNFVDILTDSDGDGVGDVNERLAGTDWEDSESAPGQSTIDVLALYTDAFREAEGGYPYTRVLHMISLSSALFEDSGTNLRLRIVGMSEVELGEYGRMEQEMREELMDSHGADLSMQFSLAGPCTAGACADLGASRTSHWTDAQTWIGSGSVSALTAAHELGHAMGLVHSYRQGEAYGAWRWSRGHYVTPRNSTERRGTIMAYGADIYGGVFSDPRAGCGAGPCGVDAKEVDGADSVATLNALRFQIAAHRVPGADADGDGFVDAADAAPEDPNDWFDVDGDGIADNADADDDNDGFDDIDDAFPLDPNEWADADLDGIGDNADDDVQDPGAGVSIRDPALRRAVEAALRKAPGSPITAEEIAGMTDLNAGYRGIQDLSGLESAMALEHLRLDGNRIRDLSPLSELQDLSSLHLDNNEITDLAPLLGLSGLYRLHLSGNPVSGIGALSGLTGLRELFLNHTDAAYADVIALPYFQRLEGLGLAGLGVRDISALAGLPLRNLDLSGNRISDASLISTFAHLWRLVLSDTGLTEIGFLEGLTGLRGLDLRGNAIVDISSLSGLVDLTSLDLANNGFVDMSALSALTELRTLDLRGNAIIDIGPLSGLVSLTWLHLANNGFVDVSALSALTELKTLVLHDNAIVDISPLSGLVGLNWLDLANNGFADVSALSALTELRTLYLQENAIVDIGPLSGLVNLTWLLLGSNAIVDIGPLSGLVNLTGLSVWNNAVVDVDPLSELAKLTWLSLSGNRIVDIGPLVEGAIFDGLAASSAFVDLDGNPLSEISVEVHVPQLRSSGVNARFTRSGSEALPTPIADPTLRSLIGDAIAHNDAHVDSPLVTWPIHLLFELRVRGARIADLAGLESAAKLERLYAASNAVADLSPLAGLSELAGLDLRDNRISDLGPLVANLGFGEGDWLNVSGNPLSEASVNEHLPALLERGVRVALSPVLIEVAAGGEPVRFRVSGYFESVLDTGFWLEAAIDDASVAAVDTADDDTLIINPGVSGQANVTVTARGYDGLIERLSFVVTVRGTKFVPLFPSNSGVRQGFLRVINRGGQDAQARIVAIDDSGARSSPLTLAIGAGKTVHLDAADLEGGNPDKGLSGSIGRGTSDWRLELDSGGDLDALSFVRASDGFINAMKDVVAVSDSAYRVPVFNPASDMQQVSSLRLVNRGSEATEAVITGVDDLGQSPGGEVRVQVPAGAAVTVTAEQLENGGSGLSGRLGDGTGKWRLEVRSEAGLDVMNLLSSPEGHLANLSGGGVVQRGGVHFVPLVLSAADGQGRQGFVRVINRSDSDGVARIQAYDDQGWAYPPLELSLSAGHAAHFDSRDLELGNAEKGLSGSAGSGIGDWRLELSSDLDIQVLAYIRTEGGFLTSVHDGAPQVGRRYEVATFYPADDIHQRSRLRIVNPGSRPAHVSIAGIDDAGQSAEDVVRMSVPAGQSRTVTAEQLEAGFRGAQGALGNGTGMWRLVVDCEQPIVVMNLLEGVTGHVTNLSPK